MLPLTDHTRTPQQVLVRLTGWVILLFIGTLVAGKMSLTGPVKAIDEPLFDSLVSSLQSIPFLTGFSQWATKLGALPVDYVMMVVGALGLTVQSRRVEVPALMVLALFGAHALQRMTGIIIEGTIPSGPEVIGAAGPYFSGGVQRVILVFGVLATVAQPFTGWGQRAVYQLALLAGLFEGLTRLVLGRHWPFDLIAAFPIGISILWIFRTAITIIPSQDLPQEYT